MSSSAGVGDCVRRLRCRTLCEPCDLQRALTLRLCDADAVEGLRALRPEGIDDRQLVVGELGLVDPADGQRTQQAVADLEGREHPRIALRRFVQWSHLGGERQPGLPRRGHQTLAGPGDIGGRQRIVDRQHPVGALDVLTEPVADRQSQHVVSCL